MSDEDIIFYSQYIFIKHFPVKLEFFFFPLGKKTSKITSGLFEQKASII